MKFLVFGAGAIGTYIGGSLILAGHQAVFVEKFATMERLRADGLRLDLRADKRRNATESYRIAPQSFAIETTLAEALKHAPFDVALFALKSFDTESALHSMKPFAENLPPFLCLSNGVDNETIIAKTLGADKALYGTVTTAVSKRGAGNIVLEKLRGVGIAEGHPLSQSLAAAFNQAYLNCRLYPDALSMKWSKMLTNLVANPASAILNMSAAEIFADSRLYKMEITMLRECLATMRAMNLRVVDLPGAPVRALALATKFPLWLSKPLVAKAAGGGRGNKMPSFHIDLYSGRPRSEVEYLHGAVAREGKARGIATPVNRTLTDILLALTHKEIPLDEFARQPEKLLARIPNG